MKVVIVENQAMYRDVLQKICEQECRFIVVGTAGDATAGIALVYEHKPEILILDIGLLGEKDGFAVVEATAAQRPAPRVLVLSSHVREYVVARCEQLHVAGFLDKSCDNLATVPLALAALAQGRTSYSAAYKEAKLAWLRDPCAVAKRLTDMEQKILPLIAHGLTNDEISAHAGCAATTVKRHRSEILRRLNLPSTPKLMAFALARGFGMLR
jgi:two-component system response regulator NreC